MKRFSSTTKFLAVFIFLLFISIVLQTSFVFFPIFAGEYNRTAGEFLRAIFEKLTTWIPFSFAEYLLLIIPLTAVCSFYLIFRRGHRLYVKIRNTVLFLFAALCALYLSFVLTFAAGYRVPAIESKISENYKNVTEVELSEAAMYLTEELNRISYEIQFTKDDGSKLSMSNLELFGELNKSFASLESPIIDRSRFGSCPKIIALSKPMTYTHISGVYTFFTGEANINVNYPDFILPFTAAHEMSHQHGIAREDEANFAAYLICENSSDPFVKYSALLNMYEFIANDLYEQDSEKYSSVYSLLNNDVKNDLIHYSSFFEKYRRSSVSKVSNAVNDLYLTSQGTDGVIAYGKVTGLFLAYLRSCDLLTES